MSKKPTDEKRWYVIETMDCDYEAGHPEFKKQCFYNYVDVRLIIAFALTRLDIPVWRLTVSEYEHDSNCEDNRSLIMSINAEEFLANMKG